ncbi:virion core protein P4a [Salmon gill poxvirus]|nr:virion core protein P4a [Salmon gill poxvirus]
MMFRFNTKTRFPKAIDEKHQQQCFNKKMSSVFTETSVKNKLLEHVIETLPYLANDKNLEWMNTTYTHPIDIISSHATTDPVQKLTTLSSLKSFSTALVNHKCFAETASSFPYKIKDGKITHDPTTDQIVNSDIFVVPDVGTISPETLQFLQFRFRHPEVISRFAGGYCNGDYVTHADSMPHVSFKEKRGLGTVNEALPVGMFADENIGNNLGMFNRLKVDKIMSSLSSQFMVPENVGAYYANDSILKSDISLTILNYVQTVLPGPSFNYILTTYGLTEVWAKYAAIPGMLFPKSQGLIMYETNATAVANSGVDYLRITWDNQVMDTRDDAARVAAPYVAQANGPANVIPDEARWETTVPNNNMVSYNTADIFIPGIVATHDRREASMAHMVFLYYFGDFFSTATIDCGAPCRKSGLPHVGYYHTHAPAAGPPKKIVLSPGYTLYLMKLDYLIGHGVDIYRHVSMSLGADPGADDNGNFSNNVTYVQQVTRGVPAVGGQAAVAAVDPEVDIIDVLTVSNYPEIMRAKMWELDQNAAPVLIPTVINPPAAPGAPGAAAPLPVPGPLIKILSHKKLLQLTPNNIKFLCKYAAHFSVAYTPMLYPGYEPINYLEKELTQNGNGKQLSMFWSGISAEEWTVMCIYTKGIISKLSLVMGLYDKDVMIDGNMRAITFCGPLNQLPLNANLKRVCFLPYMTGSMTLYKSLKVIADDIMAENATVNNLSSSEYRKKMILKSNPKLEMTKLQFDMFMSMIKDASSPIQVLAAYCVSMKEGGTGHGEFVKFSDLTHYIQTIWLILTKLGYQVSFRDTTTDDSGHLIIRPAITPVHLQAKLSRESRDTPYEKIVKSLVLQSKELLEFLAYPTKLTKLQTLETARDAAGSGVLSSIVIKNDPPLFHEVDVVGFAECQSSSDLKNVKFLQPEHDRFYEEVSGITCDPINLEESLHKISNLIPTSIRAQMCNMNTAFGTSFDKDMFNEIARKFDAYGGAYIDDLIGTDTTEDREARMSLEIKRLMSLVDRSVGSRPGSSGPSNPNMAPFDPTHSSRTKFLGHALHGADFMQQTMAKIRQLEAQSDLEVEPEIKTEVMNKFRQLFVMNRDLYKFALQLDFMIKLVEVLRAGGHTIDDTSLSADLFTNIYTKVRPLAQKVLVDFDRKIIGACRQVTDNDRTVQFEDFPPQD